MSVGFPAFYSVDVIGASVNQLLLIGLGLRVKLEKKLESTRGTVKPSLILCVVVGCHLLLFCRIAATISMQRKR